MSHRAPDENGVIIIKIFQLVWKIKIIDLKSKNLCPFIDGNLVLSYNGEIYNYIELKIDPKRVEI